MLALSGCGGASSNLTVSIKPDDATQKVRPGDVVQYQVVVGNDGPGEATGVTVRLELPTAFRYKATSKINATGATTRTQPSDPAVDTATPQWGQWSMGPPGFNADGTPARSQVILEVEVRAAGRPADYAITPHVFSDSNDEVVGKDLSVRLLPASDLNLTLAVDEPTAKHGDLIHYHLTLLNRGSGVAKAVGILVTLPDGIIFNKTEHLDGNFSRSSAIDPIPGALVVYYGGWTLPAASSARPGALTIVFTAKVLATVPGGTYPVTAQLTDSDGTVVELNDTAPVTIMAPTPSPTPSPSSRTGTHPSPTYSAPTPRPTPTPTPKRHG